MAYLARRRRRILPVFLGLAAVAGLGGSVAAQCTEKVVGNTGPLSLRAGKPFQGVRAQVFSWPKMPKADIVVEKVFRDKDGRVRVERYAVGKRPAAYEMSHIGSEDFVGSQDSTYDVPPGMQPVLVWIDDPCARKKYTIKPAEQTAYWSRMKEEPNLGPLCSDLNPQVAQAITNRPELSDELLGHRVFLGVEAYGRRTTYYSSEEKRKTQTDPRQSSERWCSLQLGVLVGLPQFDKAANHTVKIVYKSLEQKEPDASLFGVPSGYTMVEVDPSGKPLRTDAAQNAAGTAARVNPPQP
jgi:hypothetical protein